MGYAFDQLGLKGYKINLEFGVLFKMTNQHSRSSGIILKKFAPEINKISLQFNAIHSHTATQEAVPDEPLIIKPYSEKVPLSREIAIFQ